MKKAVLLLCASLLLPTVSKAETHHDEALKALKDGRILPLLEIMQKVESEYPGKVIDVKLISGDTGKGSLYYQIYVLLKGGHVIELTVDASQGDIIGVGGKGIDAGEELP